MKWILLMLAFVGLIAPYSQFLPWVLENGLDIPLLIEQAIDNRVSAGAWVDVIISAITLFAMMFYLGRSFKALDMIIVVLGTLIAGVSLGLPLFFYFLLERDVINRDRLGLL